MTLAVSVLPLAASLPLEALQRGAVLAEANVPLRVGGRLELGEVVGCVDLLEDTPLALAVVLQAEEKTMKTAEKTNTCHCSKTGVFVVTDVEDNG